MREPARIRTVEDTAVVVAVALVALAPALGGCLDPFSGPSGPGDWAREFLQADPYSRMTFEVDWIEGQRPNDQAMDLLEQRADQHLRKPGGIRIVLDDAIPGGEDRWTTDELRDVAGQHRDRHKEGSEAVMYVLYVDGRYAGGEGAVGLAYDASEFAIFKDKIRDSTSGLLSASQADVERAVVVHEMGHLLGLVNNGIPMVEPHEDPDHPRHSDNEDSVMFWAVENNPVNNFFGGRFDGAPPTQFDSDDQADMEAAGGK